MRNLGGLVDFLNVLLSREEFFYVVLCPVIFLLACIALLFLCDQNSVEDIGCKEVVNSFPAKFLKLVNMGSMDAKKFSLIRREASPGRAGAGSVKV